MAWARRSFGAFSTGTGTLTPAMPAGFSAGDVLFLFTGIYSTSDTLSVSGWTLLSPNSASPQNQLYGLVALGGDTAPSVAWTSNASLPCFAMVAAYTGGPASLSGIVAASSDRTSTATQVIAYNPLTIAIANCLVLSCGRRLKSSTANGATMGSMSITTSFGAPVASSIPNGATNAAAYNQWIQTTATNIVADGQVISIADSNLNTQGFTVALLPGSASSSQNGEQMMMGMGS